MSASAITANSSTRCAALLKPDGVALLHSICRSDGPDVTSAWIKKYIFPGGYIPALSEVVAAIEKSGLHVTDIEILRLHYAQTLREWRRRFADHRDTARRLMTSASAGCGNFTSLPRNVPFAMPA